MPLSRTTHRAAPRVSRRRRRFFQRGCPPPPPPGHAVTVGLRYGKANTEAPRRPRLKIDSAFPRNHGGRSTLFSYQGGVDKTSYLVPLPHQVYRTEALSGGPFVAPHRSTVLEVVYRVCRPSFVFAHATPRAQRSFGSSGTGETWHCRSSQW